MSPCLHLPRAVRSVLLQLFESTIERDDRAGTSPGLVAVHLLQDLEQALRDTDNLRALDELLDELHIEELAEDTLPRHLEPALTELGTYRGERWHYQDAERVLAAFESTFTITWVEPPAPAPPPATPAEPGPDAEVRRYGSTETFEVGEWLAHPTFGVGRITALAPARVTVRFADRERTLVRR